MNFWSKSAISAIVFFWIWFSDFQRVMFDESFCFFCFVVFFSFGQDNLVSVLICLEFVFTKNLQL